MIAFLVARRLWLAALIASSFAAGLTVAGTHWFDTSAGTKVLGEKVQGSGSSSQSSGSGTTPSSGNGGSGGSGGSSTSPTAGGGNGGSTVSPSAAGGGGNGQGNGGNNGNGGKSFTIAGQTNGLYPGGTVQLHLTVTNNENQPMTVQALKASLVSIVKAAGAPAGTCSPTVTIGSWTGTAFLVPRNTVGMAAPGYIPVTVAYSAPDACQGASFNLSYSGTAVQS